MNFRETLVSRDCLFLDTGKQFIGNTGKHLDGYCTIDPLLPNVDELREVVGHMVEPFLDDEVEAILTAGVGAISLGHMAAEQFIDMTGIDVKAAWADKKEPKGQEIVRSGFAPAIFGKRLLLMDGFVNSGFTIEELLRSAEEAECTIVGLSAIAVNEWAADIPTAIPKFNKLTAANYKIWTPDECAEGGPCSEGQPIVVDKSLGHGHEYQEKHPDYPGGYTNLLAA